MRVVLEIHRLLAPPRNCKGNGFHSDDGLKGYWTAEGYCASVETFEADANNIVGIVSR